MLTKKQIIKLDNPHHNTDQVHIYWCQLRLQESFTPQQLKTLQILGDMSKKQQLKYVIIEDKLVKTPTNRKVYTKLSGVWKRNRVLEGNKANR